MGAIDRDGRGRHRADSHRQRRRWAGVLLVVAGLAAVLAALLPRFDIGPPGGRPDGGIPSASSGAGRPTGGLLYAAPAAKGSPTWDIWVANPDGTGRRNLTPDAANDAEPAWSPDGRRIVYTSHQPPGCEAVGCQADLYAIGRDGTGRVRLTSTPQSESDPDWSPDDGRIAYTRWDQDQPRLWVMAANGSDQRQLADGAGQAPDWSPDAARILYGGRDNRLSTINADGSDRRRISGIGPVRGARWSPDGTRIALTMQDAIWIINADGGGLRRLKHGWYPSWSPDGRHLVYLAVSFASVRTGELQIRRMDTNGRNETILVRDAVESAPTLG